MAELAQSAHPMVNTHRQGVLMLLGATLAWSSAGLFARAIPLDTPTVILWKWPAVPKRPMQRFWNGTRTR